MVPVVKESASDGTESSDTVRVDRSGSRVLSLTEEESSSSRSSGAVNRTSSGLLLSENLNSSSVSRELSVMDLTVIRFSLSCSPLKLGDRCRLRVERERGMVVTAKSIATDGEMESGLRTSRGERRAPAVHGSGALPCRSPRQSPWLFSGWF